MAGVYGFYKEGVMKIASYKREPSPKSLGYNVYETLRLSWPQEIQGMFQFLDVVQSGDHPTPDQLEEIYTTLGGSGGYNMKDGSITFERLLGEKHDDVFGYFQSIRHMGLHYMVDGIESISTWGIIEWAYIYNLDTDMLEVWHKKETNPNMNEEHTDPYIYLSENFDLINSMVHDPNDLGRNQFSLDGMNEAYDIVYGG